MMETITGMRAEQHPLRRIRNFIVAVVWCLIVAAGITALLLQFGFYLNGSDIYGQIFRLDTVSEAFSEGSLYPLYTERWYNGYEIFRCSSPAVYSLIQLLISFFGLDIHMGICLFYGVCTFLSQMGFCLFGIRQQRMTAAALTGLAYLFLPTTLTAALFQGSFDTLMGLALLPGLLYFINDFIVWKNRFSLGLFSVLLCALLLTDYILAAVFVITALLYCLLTGLFLKTWHFSLAAAADMLFVCMAMGAVLYPALSGGLLSKSYPMQEGLGLAAGAAMLGVAVLGLLTADKSRMPGFLLTAAGLLLSADAVRPVMGLIPFAALRHTWWYVLVVAAVCLMTLLCWKRLRLPCLLLFLCILAGTGALQLMTLREGSRALEDAERLTKEYLLAEAAALTDSRVALLDASELGAFPQWYFASRDVNSVSGWDYENAATVQDQTHVNEAFADGFYLYMFDRLRLYGADVVIVPKERLNEEGALEALTMAAGRCGYELAAGNKKTAVFKAGNIETAYGVVTHYENLAIGENAAYIAYIYPSFGLGSSGCLEDYTVEELQQYKRLYLSGFSYRNKEKAENLLRELSHKGVEIYIDMQNIPLNVLTGKNEFMGVYAQTVQFTDKFPILQNDNGNQFKLDFKGEGFENWNTVYISGCSSILKETEYDNKKHLVYLGQNGEPGITFMGLNLVYYYLSAHNPDLLRFLNEIMELSPEDLTEPEISPIYIERDNHALIVRAEADNVNCGIAAVDTLEPDRVTKEQENLFLVNRGDTVFDIIHAERGTGIFFSVLGLLLLGILWIIVYVVLEEKTADAGQTSGTWREEG